MKQTIISFLLLFCQISIAQTRYYVTENGSKNNNGLTWATAFSNPNEAFAIANTGDEVWVAKGIYYTTTTNDRYISFKIPSGMKLIGGFDGSESFLSQRDYKVNKTILSGNIGSLSDSTDNSVHVVEIINANKKAIIDGFFIRDGYARTANPSSLSEVMYNSGAGIFVYNEENSSLCDAEIKNCHFEYLYSTKSGAAIFANDKMKQELILLIEGCTIDGEFFGNNFPISKHKFVYIANIKKGSTLNIINNNFNFLSISKNEFSFGLNLYKSDSTLINFKGNIISQKSTMNFYFLDIYNSINQIYNFEDNEFVELKRVRILNSFDIHYSKFIFNNNIFTLSDLWLEPLGFSSIPPVSSLVGDVLISNNTFIESNISSKFIRNLNVVNNKFQGGFLSIVKNNEAIYENNLFCKMSSIQLTSANLRTYFLNNSFKNNIFLQIGKKLFSNDFTSSDVSFTNNIFDSNDSIKVEDNDKINLTSNLFNNKNQYDLFKVNALIKDTNSIVAGPMYANESDSCSGKLKPCSRGVNEGSLYEGVSLVDIENKKRIIDRIDIGAYENDKLYNLKLALPTDTSLCKGDFITVNIASQDTIKWNDGSQDKVRNLGIGTHIVKLTDENKCSLADTLNIKASTKTIAIKKVITLCKDEIYSFQGKEYNAGDSVEYIAPSLVSCDSMISLAFKLSPYKIKIKDTITCDNKSIVFDNITYNIGDTIHIIKKNNIGCDSIINIIYTERNDNLIVSLPAEVTVKNNIDKSIAYESNVPIKSILNSSPDITIQENKIIINTNKDTTYQIIFIDEYNCELTKEIKVSIENDPNFILPNIIHLNSSQNNIWQASLPKNYKLSSCKIYDRWGNIMYSNMQNSIEWDGKCNGKFVMSGVYMYNIEAIIEDGNKTIRKVGTITVVR